MATARKCTQLPFGPMIDALEPQHTNCELQSHTSPPPPCMNNQLQLQVQPQVQAKRPAARMSAMLQPLPAISQEQQDFLPLAKTSIWKSTTTKLSWFQGPSDEGI